MRYLKKFNESSYHDNMKEISSNKEDIISTLSKYCKEYDDGNVSSLIELMWGASADAADRYDMLEEIDEECIRMIIDDIIGSPYTNNVQSLLNIYYDCSGVRDGDQKTIIEDLHDIFIDYNFDKKLRIYKSADHNDNRYVVEINESNIITKIDFIELINRVKDVTAFEKMSYSGSTDHIKIEFYKPLVGSQEEFELE